MRTRGATYNYSSVHDSRIYSISKIKLFVEQIEHENIFVLGDSAFTGFRNIKSSYATFYNPYTSREEKELGAARVRVENTFALFKNKFNRFKTKFVNGETKKGIQIIKGAMYIHNFIINNN